MWTKPYEPLLVFGAFMICGTENTQNCTVISGKWILLVFGFRYRIWQRKSTKSAEFLERGQSSPTQAQYFNLKYSGRKKSSKLLKLTFRGR